MTFGTCSRPAVRDAEAEQVWPGGPKGPPAGRETGASAIRQMAEMTIAIQELLEELLSPEVDRPIAAANLVSPELNDGRMIPCVRRCYINAENPEEESVMYTRLELLNPEGLLSAK